MIIFYNVAIVILDFSVLLLLWSSNFAILKVVALNPFASFLTSVLQTGSWLLFCIASLTVIALPTIATSDSEK